MAGKVVYGAPRMVALVRITRKEFITLPPQQPCPPRCALAHVSTAAAIATTHKLWSKLPGERFELGQDARTPFEVLLPLLRPVHQHEALLELLPCPLGAPKVYASAGGGVDPLAWNARLRE